MSNALAIQGGERTVPEGMIRGWPIIGDEDVAAVAESLRSGITWGGNAPNVSALCREWAAYCGVKHCLAVNGGTAALHMAVAAAGVGPGDEVIVPAHTFFSTAPPVLHHNGIPVFVDIDGRTFNINPALIEEQITPRTKAIIAVHLYGLCAEMDAIRAIADRRGLLVIEDACQAHGAAYKGTRAGALGRMAAFSLNGSKNLPGGEGGLFVTDDEDLRDRAALLEMTVHLEERRRVYPVYSWGWNYRMPEMVAAFTRAQLGHLDERNAQRRELAHHLTKRLSQLPGIIPPFEPEGYYHVYHMYRVRFDPQAAGVDATPRVFRDAVEKALQAEGLRIGQWVTSSLPAQALYQLMEGYGRGCPWTCPHGREVAYRAEDYPETERVLADSSVVAGVHPPNTTALMDLYADAFEKVWGNLSELDRERNEQA